MSVDQYQPRIETVSATIASGQSLSGAVNLAGCRLVGLVMPAAWTAASLTFQVSHDGTTYNDLYDDAGNEYTVVAAASRYIGLVGMDWEAVRFLKVRSGTAATPVNQAAQRVIVLVATGRD